MGTYPRPGFIYMGSSDYIVEIKDMSFAYDTGRLILDDVSLNFRRGQVIAIMGGSGMGKTTLLKLIGALFTDMTVFENVAFPLREHTDLPEELIRDLVLLKLDAVGLRGAAPLYPSEISGGMSRRVALARTVALDPDLIMYDEPFAGLDPISMGVTAQLIRNLNDVLGSTSVIVTHDVQETFTIADYVYMVSSGKIAAQGTPDELRQSKDPFVVQFVNGLPDGPVKFQYPAPSLNEELGIKP